MWLLPFSSYGLDVCTLTAIIVLQVVIFSHISTRLARQFFNLRFDHIPF